MPRLVPKDDASEGSTEYHAKSAAPHSSFQGEVAGLELEPQLSVSLTAQTERDQCIAQLTAKLALKSALLEQAEANAAETAKLREHADRLLMQTSLVMQRDVELKYMQARLDELLLSRDQQIGKYEKELANVRAKLESKESELEAVRFQLTNAEKGWIKSKAEADTLRAQTDVTRRLVECVRGMEVEIASKWWNEKSIEAMECRNEG